MKGSAAWAAPAAQEQPVSLALLVDHVPAPCSVPCHDGPTAWADRRLFAMYDKQIPDGVVLDCIVQREYHGLVPSAAALPYAVGRRSTAGRPLVVLRSPGNCPAVYTRAPTEDQPLRDLRRRRLTPMYRPFQIRPSSGFSTSSGISHIPPIFPAPGTRPCLHSWLTHTGQTPQRSPASRVVS